MIKNRYDDKLREGNQIIIDLTPGNYVLRVELALELKKIVQNKKSLKILEIGSGEGDLTKHILRYNNSVKIDCLDISKEMISLSRMTLSRYLKRINFINEDVLEYLKKSEVRYGIITSAWTLHNFTWEDKRKVFEKMFTNLSNKGKILLMDKLYVDDKTERKKSLNVQIKRYDYLDPVLRHEIIAHEQQDMTEEYRMDELHTINILKKIGFKNIRILDRVERDVLLIAEK